MILEAHFHIYTVKHLRWISWKKHIHWMNLNECEESDWTVSKRVSSKFWNQARNRDFGGEFILILNQKHSVLLFELKHFEWFFFVHVNLKIITKYFIESMKRINLLRLFHFIVVRNGCIRGKFAFSLFIAVFISFFFHSRNEPNQENMNNYEKMF